MQPERNPAFDGARMDDAQGPHDQPSPLASVNTDSSQLPLDVVSGRCVPEGPFSAFHKALEDGEVLLKVRGRSRN